MNGPFDIAFDFLGNMYFSDTFNNRIRRVDAASGIITTIAGNGISQSLDGTGAAASFRFPTSIALGTLDGHSILFVGEDDTEKKIRVIQNW